jgi:5-formyltetrahydrofolate cyclo-ligase
MKLKTLISKSEARRIVVEKRKTISEEEIRSKTKLIIERLSAVDDFIHAKKIYAFISSRQGELNTRFFIDFMIDSGKSVVLPKLNKLSKKFFHANFLEWDNLVKNDDGYYEPPTVFDDDLSDIDLFIVPAMAVSLKGQRVGYGGGYYDKILRNTHASKIVPVFEFQIFENIETDAGDIRIDKIVTERRIINTRETIMFKQETA